MKFKLLLLLLFGYGIANAQCSGTTIYLNIGCSATVSGYDFTQIMAQTGATDVVQYNYPNPSVSVSDVTNVPPGNYRLVGSNDCSSYIVYRYLAPPTLERAANADCPSHSTDLNTHIIGTPSSGTQVSWYNLLDDSPVSQPTSSGAGQYYAIYTNDLCTSTKSNTLTITDNCCAAVINTPPTINP